MRNFIFCTALVSLLCLPALLLTNTSSARAAQFCDDYGVACYKQIDAEEPACPVLDFGNPDGKYIGSVFLSKGMCWDFPFSCTPCEKPISKEELAERCNQQFQECDGKCIVE
jgi:hypothetical protein